MVKSGPCHHCGATSTPLWRNGPPDKPVLCNACGSRWRTKGSLENYTPLHAREACDLEDLKVFKTNNISLKAKEQKSHKKKMISIPVRRDQESRYCDQNFRKVVDRDTSNRSSSGSAISYSESSAHFGTIDASDMTGSVQSNVWDSLVTSKKRTFMTQSKPSPIEKLTKDLCSILHEQQSSNLSGSLEEDLIYESGTPLGSEIGYGGVLIRHSNSNFIEEESEASSFPPDNKQCVISKSFLGSVLHHENKRKILTNTGIDKTKKLPLVQEDSKRDNGISSFLQERNSPLCSADLNDVINFDVFLKCFTLEEQLRLMKYLPSMDTSNPPESLSAMFRGIQFLKTISDYQKLLQEGIFDLSFSGANLEHCRTVKRHALLNVNRSEWVNSYNELKDISHKQIRTGNESVTRPSFPGVANLISLKRPSSIQSQITSVRKDIMRSPKRTCRIVAPHGYSKCSSELVSCETGSKLTIEPDRGDIEGVCFSQRALFASCPDHSNMLVSQFTADSSDHDILLDVPCNSSFAEAELLYHPWKDKTVANDSPSESAIVEGEDSLSSFPSCSFTNKYPEHDIV